MQRALLDPRKPFRDWGRLLDGRNDLRRLQNLCEEQHDAVQEWRDVRLGDIGERLQVRFHDLSTTSSGCSGTRATPSSRPSRRCSSTSRRWPTAPAR